jgi:hypothetical protein
MYYQMSGAPKIYGKSDLRKLADSKAVPLIAHSHEVIVPVVYSGMVKKFLEDKGVKLPLTQSQLAEMKREAKAVGSKDVGHAKGGTVKQSMKNVQAVNQKVVVNIGTRKGKKRGKKRITRPSELLGGPSLYDQLRPTAWTSFRQIGVGFSNPLLGDYKKEAEEHYKKEKDALDIYKKEVEEKARNSLKELEDKKREQEQRFAALFRPAESIPIRNSFPSTPPIRSGHSSFPSTPGAETPIPSRDITSPASQLFSWGIVKEGRRYIVKKDGVAETSFTSNKKAEQYIKSKRGF